MCVGCVAIFLASFSGSGGASPANPVNPAIVAPKVDLKVEVVNRVKANFASQKVNSVDKRETLRPI
jgi:hypothetical protein